MRRFLLVANQTLGGEHLLDAVRSRLDGGACRFHVLVPATPPQDQLTWTEGEAAAIARERLEKAVARLAELGAEATGAVGDPDPLQAIGDALRARPFDEIILSTLPAGISRWLGWDLPCRVERSFGLPVDHVQTRSV
jgi:hypothetical protein